MEIKLPTSFNVLLLLLFFQACVDHNISAPFQVDCNGVQEISYQTDVKPVISSKCAIPGCHNGMTTLPNWNELSNLQMKGSEIQRRITLPLNHAQKMPQTGSISDAERQTIYCWIAQGAHDN